MRAKVTSDSLVVRALLFLVLAISPLATSLAAEQQDGEAALLAYVAIWNGGDLGQLDEIVTPDFQRHAGPTESCESLAELKKIISGAREIWKELQITVDDSMATAKGGAMRGGFYGVHRGTNGIIEFPTMSMFRFADGKIAEEWIIGDNFLSLMALGYELVPPGFEAIPPGQKPVQAPEQAPDRPVSGPRVEGSN